MLPTNEGLNQSLKFNTKAHCLTNFQWKKAFKRAVASLTRDLGWDERSAQRIAKEAMEHCMNEWKARDFAMYRKEWRIYSPEDSARGFMVE